ncbi:sigma-70 family RNA polymerase sigma factor [Paenibacillus sp. GCM10012306]|uniref:sigma-70 family RNA polymerase sigma factor n=1 Tax=Paenibacillus sp. GCM10012306 TaxID=3317342 RepID=UPI0036223BA7
MVALQLETDVTEEVRRAQAGDKDAFIHLVKELELQMYTVAKAIVKKDEDCADAMQETVLKAYQSIGGLKEPLFFKTWLLRILINECNLILRKSAKSVVMAELPGLHRVSPDYEHIDLREAVYQLEEISRNIVILHYFQDLPLSQIADILELSEGAIKTRLHRARKTLYQWLADPAERKVNV